jgi:hypothetical protein
MEALGPHGLTLGNSEALRLGIFSNYYIIQRCYRGSGEGPEISEPTETLIYFRATTTRTHQQLIYI